MHLGIAAADRGDLHAAQTHMKASLALRPSALAYRNLAVMEDSLSSRGTAYAKAWTEAMRSSTAGSGATPYDIRFRSDLASEICQWMLVSNSPELHNFTA